MPHKAAARVRLQDVTVTASGDYVSIGNDDKSYLVWPRVASSFLLSKKLTTV